MEQRTGGEQRTLHMLRVASTWLTSQGKRPGFRVPFGQSIFVRRDSKPRSEVVAWAVCMPEAAGIDKRPCDRQLPMVTGRFKVRAPRPGSAWLRSSRHNRPECPPSADSVVRLGDVQGGRGPAAGREDTAYGNPLDHGRSAPGETTWHRRLRNGEARPPGCRGPRLPLRPQAMRSADPYQDTISTKLTGVWNTLVGGPYLLQAVSRVGDTDPLSKPYGPAVDDPADDEHVRGLRPPESVRDRARPVWHRKSSARPPRRPPALRSSEMVSTKTWFETVAEAQRRAQRRLPRSVYMALVAGAEAGLTMNNNIAAFAELGFRPHVAELPVTRELSTTVMGQQVSFPVLISPTGVQAVHPDGEVAVARAAAAAGIAMGLSAFASKPVEEVGQVIDKLLFQSYWMGTRDAIMARAERARAAGAKGLIITLDWVFDSRRDWGSPWIPESMNLQALVRHVPQVAFKPAYLVRWIRSGSLPDLGVPNLGAGDVQAHSFFGAYAEWMTSAPPTWEDLAWLREQWGGPFMIKGITRPDDARRAVDVGATAISVSNHGGNNLDSTLAAIRCLPAVADAVGDQVEVVLDGGIRRGSDVVKAIALGARAVMIGRAYLWGLAANGERGVSNVLEILRQGTSETLYGLGKASIHDVAPDDVIVPEGFAVGHKLWPEN